MQFLIISHNLLHGQSKSNKWYFQSNGTKYQTFTVYKSLWNAVFKCFIYILLLHFLIVQHVMALKTLTSKTLKILVWITYDFRGLGLVYGKLMSIVGKEAVFKVLGNFFGFEVHGVRNLFICFSRTVLVPCQTEIRHLFRGGRKIFSFKVWGFDFWNYY